VRTSNDGPEAANSDSNQPIQLAIKQIDFNAAAAELAKKVEEIKKSIERIEQAKVVSKELLDREVSI